MMLNSVDFPQPEGPITDRNSPGATASETWSTAVTLPSAVSKRLTMSTTSSACGGSAAPADARKRVAIGSGTARDTWRQRGRHRRRIARLDAHIDHRDAACLDRGDR